MRLLQLDRGMQKFHNPKVRVPCAAENSIRCKHNLHCTPRNYLQDLEQQL